MPTMLYLQRAETFFLGGGDIDEALNLRTKKNLRCLWLFQAHTLVENYVTFGCEQSRFVQWLTGMDVMTSEEAEVAFANVDHHWKTTGQQCADELEDIREQRWVFVWRLYFRIYRTRHFWRIKGGCVRTITMKHIFNCLIHRRAKLIENSFLWNL